MSRISKKVKDDVTTKKMKPTVNFMGGVSYGLNPLDTLKMVAASSIFGEPQYYRTGGLEYGVEVNEHVKDYALFDNGSKNATQVFLESIKNSLDYDFKGSLELAVTLRKQYMMRLNPQVIMVMASTHPSRIEFDKSNPGEFRRINSLVMLRADEPATQLSTYLYLHGGSKSKIPSVLKRSWAEKLGSLNAYQIAKYKSAESGMINTVRICHAKGELIGELMKTGTVQTKETEKTWENLHSEGKSFKEILNTIKIPHMALLRNLRNILKELDDNSQSNRQYINGVLSQLIEGVPSGKQFPFRYYVARNVIRDELDLPFKEIVMDSLEQCIESSIENMPRLKGKTMCLTDNSGSAWGAFTSEYGTASIAEIDNLSGVIAARLSDEGEVGVFGDKLDVYPVSKKEGILVQSTKISSNRGARVGHATENGIWIFFKDAIKDKKFYDNIFIFSDQQAGHGGLYGIGDSYLINGVDYGSREFGQHYVDVMKLLAKYRKEVNPKVNFFTVQTAGYDNAVIPEYVYRGAVLTGWTGKEVLFANEIINQWDEIESRSQK